MLKANIRLIAATNRDLDAVERRDFREDLFYRLHAFNIPIPPLRDRRTDILGLTEAFLDDISRSIGRPHAGLTQNARDALPARWPGNVRELRNVLERAAILADDGVIDDEHLALRSLNRPPLLAAPTTDLSTVERDMIAKVFRETRGNKVKAAQRLGLSRTQLYGRLRKYGLA